MAVVKANAYGHGAADIARALVGETTCFGVANLAEARAVREALGSLLQTSPSIFLLGACLPAERETVVRDGFIPFVSSVAEAAAYAAHGPVQLHLVIDTGMGRMGAWPDGAREVASAIHQLPGVTLAGLASHLPVADEDDHFTATQLARFGEITKSIASEISPTPATHIANSAGVIGFAPEAGSLVRTGLALYGVSPRPDFQSQLRPVLTWKTRIILVRDYPAGHGVSYGRAFITPRSMRIATLAAGYADGYQRQISGRGAWVLIHDRRCPILGRVTMDQIMVDLSAAPGAAAGDEAVLLGRQGSAEISASTMAEWAGTIPWHIFTAIGPRVVRHPID